MAASILLIFALLLAQVNGSAASLNNASVEQLTGAGSPYPGPFLQTIFAEYSRTTGVKVVYLYSGSEGGATGLNNGTVDFATADVPCRITVAAKQLPVCGEAIAVVYNLPGLARPLKLTGEALADIYLGEISRWNDRRIQATNLGMTLPDAAISPLHITGACHDTYLLTEYLAKSSREWRSKIGFGWSVNWPGGASGRDGGWAAAMDNVGTIGYSELNLLRSPQDLRTCMVANPDGRFVMPTKASVQAALKAGFAETRKNLTASVVNMPGAMSYPIVGYCYLTLPRHADDPIKRRNLELLAKLIIGNGQNVATRLDYVPLPTEVKRLGEEIIAHDLAYRPAQPGQTNTAPP